MVSEFLLTCYLVFHYQEILFWEGRPSNSGDFFQFLEDLVNKLLFHLCTIKPIILMSNFLVRLIVELPFVTIRGRILITHLLDDPILKSHLSLTAVI